VGRVGPGALVFVDELERRLGELGRDLGLVHLDRCRKHRDAGRVVLGAPLDHVRRPLAIVAPRDPALGWPEHDVAQDHAADRGALDVRPQQIDPTVLPDPPEERFATGVAVLVAEGLPRQVEVRTWKCA
jgi:hypothetical protein